MAWEKLDQKKEYRYETRQPRTVNVGVTQFEFWCKICHQVILSHPTGTQILYCKTGLSKTPFKLENIIILQPTIPLVLQLLQSTKKAEKVEKNMKIIPDSLKFLRMIKPILIFNRESPNKKPPPPVTAYYLMPSRRTQMACPCQAGLSTSLAVLKEGWMTTGQESCGQCQSPSLTCFSFSTGIRSHGWARSHGLTMQVTQLKPYLKLAWSIPLSTSEMLKYYNLPQYSLLTTQLCPTNDWHSPWPQRWLLPILSVQTTLLINLSPSCSDLLMFNSCLYLLTLPVASAAKPLSQKHLRSPTTSTHSRKLDWNFNEIICILPQLTVTRDDGETKRLK